MADQNYSVMSDSNLDMVRGYLLNPVNDQY